MILSWMLYSVAVSLLLGCAALAAERILRLYRRPARWVWLIALVAAVFLPAAGIVFPAAIPKLPSVAGSDVGVADLAATVWRLSRDSAASAASGFFGRDSLMLAVWIATTLLLLTLYAWSLRRLFRELRTCSPAEVGGIPVLVSSALGPAVVGLKRQAIVLPSWVLECEEDVRSLIARHELEHVRKGDQYLQLGGFLFVLVLPWNLALWWYLARLRLGIEADCDLRLLNSGTNVRAYSRLLLEVGTRLSSAPMPALSFSRNRSSLFRRIQLMTSRPRKRSAQAVLAATATLTLALLACETPTPPQSPDDSAMGPALSTAGGDGPDSITVLVSPLIALRSTDGTAKPEPLISVDGVIMDASSGFKLDDLDPDKIERIEVVKGAAAAALYGERAAGGIINIFLKTTAEHSQERSPGS